MGERYGVGHELRQEVEDAYGHNDRRSPGEEIIAQREGDRGLGVERVRVIRFELEPYPRPRWRHRILGGGNFRAQRQT